MMNVEFDYGYQHNEWIAVYTDANGNRQIMPFDTFERAANFLSCCSCKVGVVKTSFYVNRVTE